MSDTTTPGTARCGVSTPQFRVTCDLLDGHVKTGDDWHTARTTRITEEQGAAHTVKQTLTEVVRWAPNEFEVPRPERMKG